MPAVIRRLPRPAMVVSVAALLALVLLSACGDDCDRRPAASTPTPTPVTADSATPRPTGRVPTAQFTATGTRAPSSPTTPEATATSTPTRLVTDVEITIGSTATGPGVTASVDVVLTAGSPVAGTQNDIAFPIEATIAARSNGRPDCTANPDIRKEATVFSFQPSGCTPGIDCTGIRAIVISFSNLDPIAVGSVLYTCRVNVADAAFDIYPLTCSRPGASDPEGNALDTTCEDGEILIAAEETRP